jgi:hypothetical protein
MQETPVASARKHRTLVPLTTVSARRMPILETNKHNVSPFIKEKTAVFGFSVSRFSFLRLLVTFLLVLIVSALSFSYLNVDTLLNQSSPVTNSPQDSPALFQLASQDERDNQVYATADRLCAISNFLMSPPNSPQCLTSHPPVVYNTYPALADHSTHSHISDNQRNVSVDCCTAFTNCPTLPPNYPEHLAAHPIVTHTPLVSQDTCPASSSVSKNQTNAPVDYCCAYPNCSKVSLSYSDHFTSPQSVFSVDFSKVSSLPNVLDNTSPSQDTFSEHPLDSNSTIKDYVYDQTMIIAYDLFDVLWEWVFQVGPPPS